LSACERGTLKHSHREKSPRARGKKGDIKVEGGMATNFRKEKTREKREKSH